MTHKKLDTVLFGAWNTYAVSMMSILEDCGMWNREDTFQKFMGMTGIAAHFCMDSECSALPVTDYDWISENPVFMERIGVRTEIIFADANDTGFRSKQEYAVKRIKESINNGRAVAAWGIDTGEFGIICGYDDDDGVFFTKGIGSSNSSFSSPILYKNLGLTYDNAPILYCEIPLERMKIDLQQAYIESLRNYSEMMKKKTVKGRAYGLGAYDMIAYALKNNRCDSFGLRYCIGVYCERKDAMFRYLSEIENQFDDIVFSETVQSFGRISELWSILRRDMFDQSMCGWNDLHSPIDLNRRNDILSIIENIKCNENAALDLIGRYIESKM